MGNNLVDEQERRTMRNEFFDFGHGKVGQEVLAGTLARLRAVMALST
jgi:hypothetical protein